MKYFVFSLLLVLTPCIDHGQSSRSAVPPGDVKTVPFCEMVRNPKLYDHQKVRVAAIYRYGYEWSQLYCLDCIDTGATWVELDESFADMTDSRLAKRIGPN